MQNWVAGESRGARSTKLQEIAALIWYLYINVCDSQLVSKATKCVQTSLCCRNSQNSACWKLCTTLYKPKVSSFEVARHTPVPPCQELLAVLRLELGLLGWTSRDCTLTCQLSHFNRFSAVLYMLELLNFKQLPDLKAS